MRKLAIVSTHPIQYYAPVFRLLNSRKEIKIKVFYTLGETVGAKYDEGFGKAIQWDIPLLDGYEYVLVKNTAENPGSAKFKGIVNPELNKLIEAWDPNAILIFGWAYKSHLKTIRYFKNKVPVYFRGDSTLLNQLDNGRIKGVVKSVFLKWVYKHVDHAFYVGKNNKEYFKRYGLAENQLSFTPHAIDNDRFEEKRVKESGDLRISLNIKSDDIIILYAGKFDPVKNVKSLLNAFLKLKKENVYLLLVGNGIEEPDLKAIAADSKNLNVIFLDFKNQSYMPVIYQAADLFCLPSKSETWGLSVNEAMACGKAVLVSDKVGCAADLVSDLKNGMVFSSGDVDSLYKCLLHLTADIDLLNKYGEVSKNIIKNWSFINIAEAIEKKVKNETDRPN